MHETRAWWSYVIFMKFRRKWWKIHDFPSKSLKLVIFPVDFWTDFGKRLPHCVRTTDRTRRALPVLFFTASRFWWDFLEKNKPTRNFSEISQNSRNPVFSSLEIAYFRTKTRWESWFEKFPRNFWSKYKNLENSIVKNNLKF